MSKMEITEAAKLFFRNAEVYTTNTTNIDLRKEIISNLINGIADKHILDIGCGDGSLSIQFLNQNFVTFLDFSDQMLELVNCKIPPKEKYKTEIIHEEFLKADLKFYDVVLCIGVLAHVESVSNFIKKISEILTPYGKCILQISDRERLLSKIFDKQIQKSGANSYMVNFLTGDIMREILSKNNCKIIEENYYWRQYKIFNLIPGKLRLPILSIINRNRFLSKKGSELFIVFSNPDLGK